MCGGHSSAAPEGVSRTVRTIGKSKLHSILFSYIFMYREAVELSVG